MYAFFLDFRNLLFFQLLNQIFIQMSKNQLINPPPPHKRNLIGWAIVLLLLVGAFSSGFSQVGSVTITGSPNVCVSTTQTYSITGASCSTANWIVGGGTIISSNNISVTVQWNNSGTTGYVSVNAYSCSPTPAERSGFLSVNVIKPPTDIGWSYLRTVNGKFEYRFTAVSAVSNCYQWSFSGFSGYQEISRSGNQIIIQFTASSSAVVCVNTCPIDCQDASRKPFCAYNFPNLTM
jgi:hypothetical protein